MKKHMKLLTLLTALILAAAPVARAAENAHDKTYIRSVMTILMTHVEALVHLTEQESRYSDNVVRHAQAIRHTVGLIGHMGSHDDEDGRVVQGKTLTATQRNEFLQLAKASRQRSRELVNAAKGWLESGEREPFMNSLNDMTQSCDACHSKFRIGAMPLMQVVKLQEQK